ncbi:hypothetical protein ACT80S_04205 [Ramlibacter sp. MAHUQ-53]|uniref:hypothetical protein n=1 Tax=unclassified Ramlibacter TaxID=2617605 RepID=UPI0036316CF2
MRHVRPVHRLALLLGLLLAAAARAQAPAPAAPAAPARAASAAASAPAPAASAPPDAPAPAASAPARKRAAARPGPPPPMCVVAQFKALGMRTHDPVQRAALAEDWLRRYLPRCTKEQVAALQSNLSTWLGTALTMDINAMVEGAVEALNLGNPAAMAQMYDSLGKAPVPGGAEVMRSGTPPAPVVQPMPTPAVLGGSVNYGNVVGPGGVNQVGRGHQMGDVNQVGSINQAGGINQASGINQAGEVKQAVVPPPSRGR